MRRWLRSWYCLLLALALLVGAGPVGAADAEAAPVSGLWEGTVMANGVRVPFRLELTIKGAAASGAFFNGDERVRSSSGSFVAGKLSLRFDHYASKLEADWDGGSLAGFYLRPGPAKPPYPFQAVPHRPSSTPSALVPDIEGQWEIAVRTSQGETAWWFSVRQSGPQVSASILRVDGDTGALTGSYRDGKFVLSHFSGARPLLMEVTPEPDGSLKLVQNGSVHFTALRSERARARQLPLPPDPTRWTSVKDPNEPLRFSGVDLTGKTVTDHEPRWKGKVVLINVMGSWCPNCHDEAPFLQSLFKAYRKQGLEVVALSFEDAEQLKNPERLRAFVKTYGLEYTVLLAGEPSELAERLPQAVNLTTWPATFFVGRDGLVHGAHAGFAGKATGAAHRRLKAELRQTVEKLLAQKP